MTLSTGTRLGPYEITGTLGAGGMGEVYRARDTRLDRIVAIKVLPAALAGDTQFRERFDREARAISALDHPHICALYDVGEAPSLDPRTSDPGSRVASPESIRFLVMQYLEGDTLEQRLKTGALPLDQALEFAMQIADALDRAHRAGIVHRDLKPGNIMLTRTGAARSGSLQIKLLDFGLAKATRPAVASAGASMLPTTPPGLTAQGTIVGTFQYMTPEQLEGRDADARSDIFAFGAVVYEMLTGKKAFEGKNHASLIGAILHVDPPAVTAVQPLVPSVLDRIVKKCLRKDADERWQTARDLLDELRWIADGGSAVAPIHTRTGSRWPERAVWIAMSAVLLAALTYFVFRQEQTQPGAVVRFPVHPPDQSAFSGPILVTVGPPQFALSPDSRTLVSVVSTAGARPMLWIRQLNETTARPLSGTEGAEYPFWSPESNLVGFFADGKLKTTSPMGGDVRVVAEDVVDPRGGTWGRGDNILIGTGASSIYRVSADRRISPVTTLDAPKEGSHRWPHFLPDGRHFLYAIRSELVDRRGTYVGALDESGVKPLLVGDDPSNALYVSPGLLLFMQSDTLMARSFDADRLTLAGQSFTVAQRIGRASNGYSSFSSSSFGALAWAGPHLETGRLSWFDIEGKALGPPISPEGDFTDFRFSKRKQAGVVARRSKVRRGPDLDLRPRTGRHQLSINFRTVAERRTSMVSR